MIKNILLDVDGTLMDTENAFYISLNKTLRLYGIHKSYDSALFGMSTIQVIDSLKIQSIVGFKEQWENLFATECEKLDFYPGIEEMIRALSNRAIHFYIITSRSRNTVVKLFDNYVINTFIDGAITAEDTEFHKPNPEPIIRALAILKARKDETIYVGDTFSDYSAASAAGILFGQAGWNKSAINDSYDMVFYHPSELITLFGGMR